MAEPFKNRLNATVVAQMAADLTAAAASVRQAFDAEAFLKTTLAELDTLELMDRVRLVARGLAASLPADFDAAVRVCLGALCPPSDPAAPEASTRVMGGVAGFAVLAVTRWVAEAGLDRPADALAALRAMTSRFSAEFDVRPYLLHHPAAAWPALAAWAEDADAHVRRLASEGTRAWLPWGMRVPALVDDPEPGLAILERLKDDPSEYVRRSVANHLNDVARKHPERARQVAKQWLVNASTERQALVRHGLRGLVRKGDSAALALLGFDSEATVTLVHLSLGAPTVRLGEKLPFTATVRHAGDAPLPAVVDYVLHRVLARGHGTKVFRVAKRKLAPATDEVFDTHHDFRPVTTRVDRPGTHRIELRVNGQVLGGVDFEVLPTLAP